MKVPIVDHKTKCKTILQPRGHFHESMFTFLQSLHLTIEPRFSNTRHNQVKILPVLFPWWEMFHTGKWYLNWHSKSPLLTNLQCITAYFSIPKHSEHLRIWMLVDFLVLKRPRSKGGMRKLTSLDLERVALWGESLGTRLGRSWRLIRGMIFVLSLTSKKLMYTTWWRMVDFSK